MTAEKRWAILIREDGKMQRCSCDTLMHDGQNIPVITFIKDYESTIKKSCYLIPVILDVEPPEETPDGVRRKQKGMYLLESKEAGPSNANKNNVATDMVGTFLGGIDLYGTVVLMDSKAEGEPIGMSLDEATYIIRKWSKKHDQQS